MDYLSNLKKDLNEICEKCDYYGTEKCKSKKCNIGFARYIIQYANKNSIQILKGGEQLIPKDDMLFYDEESIANGIANVCRLCKECNENHNEDCIISLIRRSLEGTQLQEIGIYPGNVLTYIINISKQNPKLAELIKERYMRLS